jgi:hypothetical protein
LTREIIDQRKLSRPLNETLFFPLIARQSIC